jgi:hypothetical protein
MEIPICLKFHQFILYSLLYQGNYDNGLVSNYDGDQALINVYEKPLIISPKFTTQFVVVFHLLSTQRIILEILFQIHLQQMVTE